MTGRTHKAGGALAMLLAYKFGVEHNLLLKDISPWVQLLIMYQPASWGSTVLDADHGNIESVPDKTPVIMGLHALLHKTGRCVHRSWQTHSWSFTGVMIALAVIGVTFYSGYFLNSFESNVLRLMIYGFSVGAYSHLILDMLSMDGVYLWFWFDKKTGKQRGIKIRLVPHTSTFGTGTPWEDWVRRYLYVCIFITAFDIVYGCNRFIVNVVDFLRYISTLFNLSIPFI